MRDLGSRVERRWGSSPHARTISKAVIYLKGLPLVFIEIVAKQDTY